MNIHKNDNVQIIAGKDRGKRGKVLKVDSKTGKILVEGVNMAKKHQRPKRKGEKGEIISKPRYVDVSNTMLICGSCAKPVRIGYRTENSQKVRYCRKCQSIL